MRFLLALACAGAPPTEEAPTPPAAGSPPGLEALPADRDVPFRGAGRYQVGALHIELTEATLALPGARAPLAVDLLGAPVAGAGRLCAVEDAGGDGRLVCYHEGADGAVAVELARGGRPDRLALSPDGAALAWVASAGGLPVVYVAPADGSAAPRALVNEGLPPAVGGPPPGFVPPPLGDSLRFDGDTLRWESPDGPREVAWR